MAEGPDPREKPLDQLEREITCGVCHDHYDKAKLLPCNHYYCSTCIEKMAARSRGGPFHCPECLKETSLPPGGVAELQPAFFVERLKDLHGKMARAEGKAEAICEQCATSGNAVAFCRQCADFICENCVLSHKNLRIFAGHVVSSLEELKKGGVKNIPLKDAPPVTCADHGGEPKRLFCFDCECLICRDCTIIDHVGHKFEFVNKCAPESRRTLRQSLAPLQKVQADLAEVEKRLVSEEAKVGRQEEEVCRSIRRSYEQLKAVLEQREVELVGKVSSLAQEKKNALAAQKTVLHVAQKEIQLLAEFVERNVESTSDQDLMSICTQLQSKVEEEEKRHRQLSLEPTATADIACCLPSPDAIPSDLGSVFVQQTPLLIKKVKSIELGFPVQVTLFAPTASLGDISAGLKCVADPSPSLEGEVVENGVCTFSISVTPQVRGRHDLTVKVRGEEIEGSPFRVFIKLPPSRLGQEDQTCRVGEVWRPWGIAINKKQQLIVGEACEDFSGGRKITVMERDGKKVQTIECDQFQDPHGVAVSSDGAVYVTDIDAECLFKFNSRGKLLKTVRNKLQKPYSVKIIDNQVYVVDYASQQIKIFDMDCNVVGTVKTKVCPQPGDIAQGPDGLYVAGEGKISVYQCAPNGVFIRHLNLTPSSLKLSEFNGICFDTSGHIIASDTDNGVYVFQSSGECVGHVSSDVISYPAGVAVDEDGFVYVCDYDEYVYIF